MSFDTPPQVPDKASDTGVLLARPAFDPELQPVLDAILASFPDTLDIESMRKSAAPPDAKPILDKYPDLKHAEHTIPGLNKDDPSIIVSVVQPKAPSSPKLPACYFLHGGGQVMGDRFSQFDHMISYYDGTEAVFASIEYRLAPEYRAPAALHDSYAGLLWLVENAASLGIDESKIIVAGGSGGAPLTAGTALLCRDNKKPFPCGMVLLTPMLDDRCQTLSSRQFETKTMWNGKINRQAWQFVLGEKQGGPDVDPLTAPARVEDLTGLPPAFIDVGECEVFRDEAVEFASKLWKCGVSTELHVWPGAFHGFDIFCFSAGVGRDSVAAKRTWIKRTLAAIDAKQKTAS